MSKQKWYLSLEQHQKNFLHYLDLHLTNSFADTVILHVGVNDLLENNSQSKIENFGKNLRPLAEKRHAYGIKNVFISGLFCVKRPTIS